MKNWSSILFGSTLIWMHRVSLQKTTMTMMICGNSVNWSRAGLVGGGLVQEKMLLYSVSFITIEL